MDCAFDGVTCAKAIARDPNNSFTFSSYPVLISPAGKWRYEMMGLKGRTVVSRIGGSPLRRSPAAAVLRRMMRADHSARPEDGTTVGKTLHRIVEKTLPDEI